jgi:hypothetical protein
LEESGWADKWRRKGQQLWERDRQVWEERGQKTVAENAELKERLRLFQQAQATTAMDSTKSGAGGGWE